MDSCICLGLEDILPQPSELFSGMLFELSYQRIVKGGRDFIYSVDQGVYDVSAVCKDRTVP